MVVMHQPVGRPHANLHSRPSHTLLARNEELFGVQDGLLIHDEDYNDRPTHGYTIPKILHRLPRQMLFLRSEEISTELFDVYDDFEYMVRTFIPIAAALSTHQNNSPPPEFPTQPN